MEDPHFPSSVPKVGVYLVSDSMKHCYNVTRLWRTKSLGMPACQPTQQETNKPLPSCARSQLPCVDCQASNVGAMHQIKNKSGGSGSRSRITGRHQVIIDSQTRPDPKENSSSAPVKE